MADLNTMGVKSCEESNQSIDWKSYFMLFNKKCLAICLQEIWRYENEILKKTDYFRGPNVLNGNRGSQGVVIALSQEGVISGKQPFQSYTMILVLHNSYSITPKSIHSKYVSVFLVSAYAPVGNAPDVWNEYLDKLITCIQHKRK